MITTIINQQDIEIFKNEETVEYSFLGRAINSLRFNKERFRRPCWRKTKAYTKEANEILLLKANHNGRHDVNIRTINSFQI